MLKLWVRILGVACCAAALIGCSSSGKGPFWGSEQTQSAQSLGLGEGDEFDIVSSSNYSEDQVVSGQKIYFFYDKYTIEPAYKGIVAANVKYLISHPQAKIRVEGHTDEVGSREYNIAILILHHTLQELVLHQSPHQMFLL